jgi:enterochelin esterase-like enzyme
MPLKIDGETVIFEWHGTKAPKLIGDFNYWDASKSINLTSAGRNLWRCALRFPSNAYIEYVYLMDGKRTLDPTNQRRVYNGINAENNYFYMPDSEPIRFSAKIRGVPHGVVKHHKVDARFLLGGDDHSVALFERDAYFYQPPVAEPVPLLVVFDGPDYLRRARLPIIVDNLIHKKRIRPFAMAMIAHGKQNRFIEYACSDVTLGFLQFNVLPLAKKELNLIGVEQTPGAYGVLGASMGGLMALYAGLRLPEIFGQVLSQSGAFYPDFVVNTLVQTGQGKQTRIWMDVGALEYLLAFNRQMHTLLINQGYTVAYREFQGGHNYTAWRDDLAAGLEYLFGI